MKNTLKQILHEIDFVLNKVDEQEITNLIEDILKAKTIVVCGAGRVGMAIRGFGMRLAHLGLKAYTLGDSNVPSISEQDLLIVASGSGETQTIFDLVEIANKNKSKIALITGNTNSRMAKIAQTIVTIKSPSKVKEVDNFKSIQPMTTLNEQCLAIFFDWVVLLLMEKMQESHDTMWARHSNLE